MSELEEPVCITPADHRCAPENCCSDPSLAERLTGLKVAVYFPNPQLPNGPPVLYFGKVDSCDEWEEHRPRYIHHVVFEDGDRADYTFEQILLYHECYLASLSNTPDPPPHTSFDLPRHTQPAEDPTAPSPLQPAPPPDAVPTAQHAASAPIPLPNPASFHPTPIHVVHPTSRTRLACNIVRRLAMWDGSTRWVLRPTDSAEEDSAAEFDLPDEELRFLLLQSNQLQRASHASYKCSPPSLACLQGLTPDPQHWTSNHPLVGRRGRVSVASGGPPAPRTRAPIVEAKVLAVSRRPNQGASAPLDFLLVSTDAAKPACFFHTGNLQAISDALLSYDLAHSSRTSRASRRRRRANHSTPLPAANAISNADFKSKVEEFGQALPDDPLVFWEGGFLVRDLDLPHRIVPTYKRALLSILSLALSTNTPAAHKVFLLFDPLIRAPVPDGQGIASTLSERLELFLCGDFQTLVHSSLCKRQGPHDPASASTSTHPSDTFEDSQAPQEPSRAHAAQFQLQRKGSVRTAAKRLAAPQGTIDPMRVLPAMKALCPQAGDDLSPGFPTRTRDPLNLGDLPASSPTPFTPSEVVRGVRNGDTGSAGGLSGQTYGTLRAWVSPEEGDELTKRFTDYLNRIYAPSSSTSCPHLPHCIRELLIAGRAVLIPKNQRGDVRPIVVGHVFTRLAAWIALRAETDNTKKHFFPHQLAVGVASGAELAVFGTRALLDENPNWVHISADAKNAFNSFTRQAFWPEISEHFPNLAHLVNFMYGVPSAQIFFDPAAGAFCSVPSSVGSRQGCVLGSFLYCLALHPILKEVANRFGDQVVVMSYADDATFTGPPGPTIQAFLLYKQRYQQQLQGQLRDDKSLAYSPSLDRETLLNLQLPTAVPFTKAGCKQLGAAIGTSDFSSLFLLDKLKSLNEELHTLSFIPSLQAQHIILNKSLSRKVNHLLRTIPNCGDPVHRHSHVLAQLDDKLRRAMSRICGAIIPSDSVAWTVARLPTRHGGLGLPSPSTTADSAFVAAYLHARMMLPLYFPAFFSDSFPSLPTSADPVPAPPTLPQARAAFEASIRLLQHAPKSSQVWEVDQIPPVPQSESKRPPEPAHLQREISTLVADATRDNLLTRLNPRDKALLLSHAGDYSSISCTPHRADYIVPNDQWLIGMKRRLLLDLITFSSESVRCQCSLCGKPIDAKGDHFLSCRQVSSGARTSVWHDGLVRSISHVLRSFGITHRVEPTGIIPFRNLRPDLLIPPDAESEAQGATLLDVRTCISTNKDQLHHASAKSGHAASQGEAEKNAKWQQHAFDQGCVFVPICVEDGGRLGNAFRDLLESIGASLQAAGESSVNQRAFMAFALNHIQLTNFKAVARVIQQNTYHLVPEATRALTQRIPGPLQRRPSPYHRCPRGSTLPVRFQATPAAQLPAWALSNSTLGLRTFTDLGFIPQAPLTTTNTTI